MWWWFKEVNLPDVNYHPIPTSEQDTPHIQRLDLKSNNSLLDKLLLSQFQTAYIRWNKTIPAPRRATGSDTPKRSQSDGCSRRITTSPGTTTLTFDNPHPHPRFQFHPEPQFAPLAADTAAQNLLRSMKEDSERIRRSRAQQEQHRERPTEKPREPDSPIAADIRRLIEEVEDLRRDNEIYSTLARQLGQSPSLAPPSIPSVQSDTVHDVPGSEAQRLRDEAARLRSQNGILQSWLIASSCLPPPVYAPPPYAPLD
ncbi:hypothetical protein H0H92_012205 [Tricholoma furcatifolium]|nr:hypothetical protein H0H92_012205 [Tricholoma furcatifolium]